MNGLLRCARCGHTYREADNGDGACAHHPGRLRDYDQMTDGEGFPGDFWECCMGQIRPEQTALDVPGCARGRHVELEPGDPGPVRREKEFRNRLLRLVLDEELPPAELAAARDRLGRFLAGTMSDPTYAERLWMDARVMDLADFPWLLGQLTDPKHALERRQLVAGSLANKEHLEILRTAGLDLP